MSQRVHRYDDPNRLGETPRERRTEQQHACSVCGSTEMPLVGYRDGVWRCIPHHRPETP